LHLTPNTKPTHMKKILSTLIVIITTVHSYATWQPLGAGVGGRVYALAVHNNELYAGGNFTGLISKWDGTNWFTVGAGLSGTSVRCLISFNGDLYAGGTFTIGGTSGNIARWDGTNWVGVGDGLGGVAGSGVLCLYEFNGVMYAGGTFTQSGISSLSKVGKLVNSNWAQGGGGAPTNCSAGVYAMTNYQNQLYVGGQGSAPWMNILDLTGTQWVSMPSIGSLVSGVGVYALSAFHYPSQSTISLFIGGDFMSPPSSTCCVYSNGLWGTALNTFSSGATDQVNAFLSTTDHLYAGGVFTVQGAVNLAGKGTTLPWSGLGVTINGSVDAFAIYHGFMVCGGNFTVANGDTVNHVMINDGVFVSANDLTEKTGTDFFPNPTHSSIHYSPDGSNDMRQLTIYDVGGKQVFDTQVDKECDIDLSQLKSGIYFYYISERGIKIRQGKVVLE
jgi:hypothetical protein